MSQTMACFAIIDDQPEHDPMPIRGWAAVPLSPDLTDDERLRQAAPHIPSGCRAVRLDITDEAWATRPIVNPALSDGKIIQGPSPIIPLKEQATTAIQQVQQQASMTSAMGETFGPEMQAYVRALRAIISGTDTASTTLPTAPAEPTL